MDLSFKNSCIGFLIVHLLFAVARNDPFQGQYLGSRELGLISKDHLINATSTTSLLPAADSDDYDTDRTGWMEGGCSKESIYISQGQTPPLPSGIPTYTALIENICMPETETGIGSCSISGIHLSCGWFSSARTINPNVFRRIDYDDCLVNNGNPIGPGQTIVVEYANTYPYPLSVSSVSCN